VVDLRGRFNVFRLLAVLVVVAGVALVATVGPGPFRLTSLAHESTSVLPSGPAVGGALDGLRTVGRRLPLELHAFVNQLTGGHDRLGLTVEDMTPELARFFDVRGGVLVTSVELDSPAAAVRITAGDVITEVDGETIEGRHDFERQLESIAAGRTAIVLVRDRKPVRVVVSLEAANSTH
jgi:membrane-associated protease RseP (regulator of RpoE activity)